jgi:hypothetical protein
MKPATYSDPETLQQAIEFFADEDRAHAYLVRQRWPNGVVTCPTCGSSKVGWIATRRLFECRNAENRHPKRQFSVKVGTIYQDSPLPLKHWMLATWMLVNCKNGVSSYEIARAIGVTQKATWHMLHRIRLAMQAADGGKLGGEVEVDETFIGGRARFMHRDKREKAIKGRGPMGKTAVMGLLQRHPSKGKSRVRLAMVETRRRHQLMMQLEKHVEDGAKVYTDELASYDRLGLYYQHQVINHAEAYVEGQVHTNGMENFWALLKRTIKGTYVSIEPFHLHRYLDEQARRFNERDLTDGERFRATLKAVTGKTLTFAELTGKAAEA